MCVRDCVCTAFQGKSSPDRCIRLIDDDTAIKSLLQDLKFSQSIELGSGSGSHTRKWPGSARSGDRSRLRASKHTHTSTSSMKKACHTKDDVRCEQEVMSCNVQDSRASLNPSSPPHPICANTSGVMVQHLRLDHLDNVQQGSSHLQHGATCSAEHAQEAKASRVCTTTPHVMYVADAGLHIRDPLNPCLVVGARSSARQEIDYEHTPARWCVEHPNANKCLRIGSNVLQQCSPETLSCARVGHANGVLHATAQQTTCALSASAVTACAVSTYAVMPVESHVLQMVPQKQAMPMPNSVRLLREGVLLQQQQQQTARLMPHGTTPETRKETPAQVPQSRPQEHFGIDAMCTQWPGQQTRGDVEMSGIRHELVMPWMKMARIDGTMAASEKDILQPLRIPLPQNVEDVIEWLQLKEARGLHDKDLIFDEKEEEEEENGVDGICVYIIYVCVYAHVSRLPYVYECMSICMYICVYICIYRTRSLTRSDSQANPPKPALTSSSLL